MIYSVAVEMRIIGLTKYRRQTLKRKGRRLWRPQRRWVRTRQSQKASQTNRAGLKPTDERDGGREVRAMSGKSREAGIISTLHLKKSKMTYAGILALRLLHFPETTP